MSVPNPLAADLSTATTHKGRKTGHLRPWKKGQSGNPYGRPLGSRQKVNERFLHDFASVWNVHGRKALVACAKDDPSTFVRVAAALLPAKVDLDIANRSDRTLEAVQADIAAAIERRAQEIADMRMTVSATAAPVADMGGVDKAGQGLAEAVVGGEIPQHTEPAISDLSQPTQHISDLPISADTPVSHE